MLVQSGEHCAEHRRCIGLHGPAWRIIEPLDDACICPLRRYSAAVCSCLPPRIGPVVPKFSSSTRTLLGPHDCREKLCYEALNRCVSLLYTLMVSLLRDALLSLNRALPSCASCVRSELARRKLDRAALTLGHLEQS